MRKKNIETEVAEVTEETETEVVDGDEFTNDFIPFSTAEELSRTDVKAEVRSDIVELVSSITKNYFQLAALLHDVRQNSYYIAWGFRTWREYAETEVGIGARKADYLVQIYDWFGSMGANAQQWVEGLGWTKAKELVGVVDEQNIDEWRSRIDGLSFSQMKSELEGHVDAGALGEDGGDGGSSSGSGDGEKTSKLSFALYPAQKANVEQAIAAAKKAVKSDKDGHALDLICSDYLASTAGIVNMNDYFRRIESITGLRLIAFDQATNEFAFGEDVIEEILSSQNGEDGDAAE